MNKYPLIIVGIFIVLVVGLMIINEQKEEEPILERLPSDYQQGYLYADLEGNEIFFAENDKEAAEIWQHR